MFLQELENHRGNAKAAIAALEIPPDDVFRYRESNAEFRDQWDRIVFSFTDDAQSLFLSAYERSHKVVLAAREAGIPRETLYRMRQNDHFFRSAWMRIEDRWGSLLGRPGGDPDRHRDADVEVIRHRLRGKLRDQVIDLYRRALAWPSESIPRSSLKPGLGLPPTSVQKDYDEWVPQGGRRGGQAAGERVEFSREFVIEMLVYRYVPGSDARKALRK